MTVFFTYISISLDIILQVNYQLEVQFCSLSWNNSWKSLIKPWNGLLAYCPVTLEPLQMKLNVLLKNKAENLRAN